MTDWKADLDALIDKAMAFAKRIHVEPPLPRTIVEPNRIHPINWDKSEREEIGERVANFRAAPAAFHEGARSLCRLHIEQDVGIAP